MDKLWFQELLKEADKMPPQSAEQRAASIHNQRIKEELRREAETRDTIVGKYQSCLAKPLDLLPDLDLDHPLLAFGLSESEVAFGGPPAWEKIDLGQTSIHKVTWILNTKLEGFYCHGGLKLGFVKTHFPQGDDSPEWWCVDMLNNIKLALISWNEARYEVARLIQANKLNAAKLKTMLDTYGTLETQRQLCSVL